jgi:hypothetical protein
MLAEAASPEAAEAVAQVTGVSVSEQAPEQAPETVNKPATKAAFIVMEDPKDIFLSRIQINENDIKHQLIMHDTEILSHGAIFPDGLTGKALERAEAASRYNILDLINDGKAQNWIYDNHRDKNWKQFIKVLNQYDVKFTKLFNEVSHKNTVKFQLLPYFIKKDMLLAVKLDEDTWGGLKVTDAKIQYSWMGARFVITGRMLLHDGKGFKEAQIQHAIGSFDDEKTFVALGIKLADQDEELRNNLIERGKKYEKLHSGGPVYMSNKGPIVRRSWWFDHEFPATGRVMIDRVGMVNIDPNYDKYFGHNRYHDNDDSTQMAIQFTDEHHFICSPYCYGFSFVAKQWGEIKIDQLTDINFRAESYDNLVLNPETKDILFSLTETSEQGKDLIDGKGGGCIFLLHGTPGVGKTLTAETIAETLKRPLYMVSVGELGTDVSSLEQNLRNILQVSSSWNAVLLIDEVDIFLEKRDLDIHRNALVGVFLRLLEYYNGILFLTTNRVNHIDPAFYSRISLAIKYPELSPEARTQIWKVQANLYQVKMTDEEYERLGKTYMVNGRQIKNCVRIVTSLCKRRETEPGFDDFVAVVNKVEEFNQVLDRPEEAVK